MPEARSGHAENSTAGVCPGVPRGFLTYAAGEDPGGTLDGLQGVPGVCHRGF